jgi:Na+-driven multidrug efflux pump
MDQGRRAQAALRRFATATALVTSGILMLLACTPLSSLWFQGIAGLSPQLTAFATLPVAILFIQPALTVLVCYQRAALVVARTTRPITWATALEVGGIVVVLLALTHFGGWVGATAAACALVVGRATSGLYLLPKAWRLA